MVIHAQERHKRSAGFGCDLAVVHLVLLNCCDFRQGSAREICEMVAEQMGCSVKLAWRLSARLIFDSISDIYFTRVFATHTKKRLSSPIYLNYAPTHSPSSGVRLFYSRLHSTNHCTLEILISWSPRPHEICHRRWATALRNMQRPYGCSRASAA